MSHLKVNKMKLHIYTCLDCISYATTHVTSCFTGEVKYFTRHLRISCRYSETYLRQAFLYTAKLLKCKCDLLLRGYGTQNVLLVVKFGNTQLGQVSANASTAHFILIASFQDITTF